MFIYILILPTLSSKTLPLGPNFAIQDTIRDEMVTVWHQGVFY